MATRADEVRDWQLSCESVMARGAALLESGEWSDCEFLVGAAQAPLRAHKLILGMASPVFAAMFLGALAEGAQPVRVPDMEPEAFTIMLQYIYSDDIKIKSSGVALNLYYGAQKYMLPHLMDVSRFYLITALNPENVCQVYEFANLIGDCEIIKLCLEVFQSKTRQVLQSSSFVDAQMDTVVEIFSQDQLEVDSEMDLFKAAERYAQAVSLKGAQVGNTLPMDKDDRCEAESQETQTSSDASSSAAGTEKPHTGDKNPDETIANMNIMETATRKDTNERTAIRSRLLGQVRFLAMGQEEFAEHDMTSLLSESDIMSVSLNLLSKNTYVNLPKGFSTCRLSRIKPTRETVLEQQTTLKMLHTDADFYLTVKNVKNMKTTLRTEKFYIEGVPWRVKCSRTPDGKHLCVCIFCDMDSKTTIIWDCQADGTFQVQTNDGTKRLSEHFNDKLSFVKKCHTKKFLIHWIDLLNPNNGYIKDEAVKIKVYFRPRWILRTTEPSV